MNRVRGWLLRRAARVHHGLWWLRAKTLGVRVVALDERGLLLVRHTYVPGWHLPGGAVDAGETAAEAARRELREEAGVACLEPPVLLGFYRNMRHSRRDHVACYVVRRFQFEPRPPDWEIAEIGVFALDALPPDTTRATHARLAELLEGAPISEDW